MNDNQQLRAAIAAQESLRGTVPDDVVDVAVDALRQRLDAVVTTTTKRRRLVTVLFADVSGSTALGERLDVEELSDRFDRLWEAVDSVIERHGGRIDKHIGDGVMALWGSEVSTDHDAERAIRAALEMQRTMVESGSDIGADGLQLRIGVNTGPVVLGAIASTDEFNVMGDTVNVAARLEAAAPVGGVLVGHDTYRHVRGVFTVSRRDPLLVKGKREPLRTYLVEGIRPRAFHLPVRDIEGVEARMVGRDDELRQLVDALHRTVDTSSAHVVNVVGEAGAGKSRLVFEFGDWLRIRTGDVRLFHGRTTPERSSVPYALLRDLVFDRFEIADDEAPEVALAKLTVGLRELGSELGASDARVAAHLIGLDVDDPAAGPALDPVELTERGADVIGRLLVGASRDMPAVILLEDVHWADRSSVELLQRALAAARSSPILLVAVSRPTPTGGLTLGTDDRVITISPLTDAATGELIDEILQRVDVVPEQLRAEIVHTASGHPYFVEELIRMLIDDGVVVIDGDQWRIDREHAEFRSIPATVSGVVQARLDRLEPAERATLRRSAVVGRVFWDDVVPRGSSGVGALPSDLSRSLAELESRGLIEKVAASGGRSSHEFQFAHAMLHEAVYDTLLRTDRTVLHGEVARRLAERSDAVSLASTIAAHFVTAGESSEAAVWFARAGSRARQRHAADEAIRACQAALDTGGLDPADELGVLDDLSEALLVAARYDEALAAADRMADLAVEVGDGVHRSIALMQQSHLHLRLGAPRDALAAAESAVDHAQRADAAPEERVEAATEVCWVLLRLGEARSAIERGVALLDTIDPSASRRAVRNLQSAVGAAHNVVGEYAEAEERFAAALSLDRSRGDRRGEAGDLINLGEAIRLRGDPDTAVARFEEALSIVREIGDRDQEALVLSNLGGASLEAGDVDRALARLDEALLGFEWSGNSEHLSETHRFMAEARLAAGRVDEAGRSARRALDLARLDENPDHLGHAWRVVGLVAAEGPTGSERSAAVDDHDAARCLTAAVEVFTRAGMDRDRAIALGDLADVIARSGDGARASAILDEVREILDRLRLARLRRRIERRLGDSGVVV